MVRVLFMYDEDTGLWDAVVAGTQTLLESKQAFSAVVMTCQALDPAKLIHTLVEDTPLQVHKITPAV